MEPCTRAGQYFGKPPMVDPLRGMDSPTFAAFRRRYYEVQVEAIPYIPRSNI